MKYGYHSPERTKEVAETLKAHNISFTDISWRNDETDSFEVLGFPDYTLWIGDPENPDYYTDIFQDRDTHETLATGLENIIAFIKKNYIH